jgi:hypothetical protein
MSEQTNSKPENGQQSTGDAWREVGKQFEVLGETLASAFRTAWNDEQNRKRMQEMQHGVESMLNDVAKAIDETIKSPQMQQTKTEVKKVAVTVKTAGEQTFQEVRPQLVSALSQLNAELQKLVTRIETKSTPEAAPEAKPPEEPKA